MIFFVASAESCFRAILLLENQSNPWVVSSFIYWCKVKLVHGIFTEKKYWDGMSVQHSETTSGEMEEVVNYCVFLGGPTGHCIFVVSDILRDWTKNTPSFSWFLSPLCTTALAFYPNTFSCIVPSFLIGAHFYTPQYSLPARKSAPQSKMNHR